MTNPVVFIENNDIFVGTWALSIGFQHEHRFLKRLVEKYKDDFDDFGFIAFERQQMTSKKGHPIHEYVLNEGQAIFLTTLLSNNDSVRKFKKLLSQQFIEQRRKLLKLQVQQQNVEWLEKRKTGKIERRLETDIIQRFVQYAKSQGSQNAEKYYIVISKMENTALFSFNFLNQRFTNLREMVNTRSLDALMMCDRIVGKALQDGMNGDMNYKEIYEMAKERVLQFSEVIGKTPIELAMNCNLTIK